jgi:2-dehydro-3-deoxygluconokinase
MMMSKKIKIACVGEVMIELIARENVQATIGVAGDTYNTAVYLKQLCKQSEIDISYITALGEDQFSKRIFSEIEKHGLRTNLIEKRQDLMPGLYAIDTDKDGERNFSYWRGQSAAKTLFQEPCEVGLSKLLDFDLIYISGISMAILPSETRIKLIEFLREYRNQGGKLAYDSNYRPRLWEDIQTARNTNMAMWSIADVALPSIDDEMLLFEDKDEASILKRLRDAGVVFGALKRGASGPLAIGKSPCETSFKKIETVVDTTAAGDSFNAGFLYQYATGGSLANAMQAGHNLASKVIQSSGAIIALD